jgi:hypothetical protein
MGRLYKSWIDSVVCLHCIQKSGARAHTQRARHLTQCTHTVHAYWAPALYLLHTLDYFDMHDCGRARSWTGTQLTVCVLAVLVRMQPDLRAHTHTSVQYGFCVCKWASDTQWTQKKRACTLTPEQENRCEGVRMDYAPLIMTVVMNHNYDIHNLSGVYYTIVPHVNSGTNGGEQSTYPAPHGRMWSSQGREWACMQIVLVDEAQPGHKRGHPRTHMCV